jgi:Zn-dependent peptidase ImmA (M78 family)
MSLSLSQKETLSSITKVLYEELNMDLKDPIEKVNSINPNIVLIRFPLDTTISGFYANIDDTACIYINSSYTLGHQYTTFWHEYYHSIDDYTKDHISFEENHFVEDSASYFSYCMLLPENEVRNTISHLGIDYHHMDIQDIINVQYTFRVSLQALLYRLKEIYGDHFSKFFIYSQKKNHELYKTMVKQYNFPIELIEPTNDFCMPKKFLKNIYYNLQNNLIGENKALAILKFIKTEGVCFKW